MIAGSEMYNCDEIKCECHNKSFFNSCAHADDRHYASCDTRLKPKPKPKTDWISVEDKPKKSGDYICSMYEADVHELHYDHLKDKWYWEYDGMAHMWIDEVVNVTHYMPLPEPPKTRSEG